MSLKASIQRRIYHWKLDRIERRCEWEGHQDFGCWSEGGSLGDRCGKCERILWTWWPGKQEHQKPRYQPRTRRCDADFR